MSNEAGNFIPLISIASLSLKRGSCVVGAPGQRESEGAGDGAAYLVRSGSLEESSVHG